MKLAADLGGIFIVPDVTARACFCTNDNYGRYRRLDTNYLSSVVHIASLFTFSHALKTFI